jgi:glycosyltransferase involved in cell wall biosynthesis
MKISVIIPVYNASKTIVRTLDSVVNQSLKPFEIIVINDGSVDNSREIIENYIKNKNHFTLINKENGGVSTARNAGMKIAKGNFIAFLDSDDEWLPNKLEIQVEVFAKNPHIDFLATNRNEENFNRILWKRAIRLHKISAKVLLVKNYFSTPTVMFKSIIMDKIGYFDEKQCYAEEGNYFIRIAQQFNCYLLNESLVLTGGGKHHFGESGLSGNLKEMEKGELKNLKDALSLKIINILEYLFLVSFSVLKYIRRIVVTKLR